MRQSVILIHVAGMVGEDDIRLHLCGKSFDALYNIQQRDGIKAIVRQGSKMNVFAGYAQSFCGGKGRTARHETRVVRFRWTGHGAFAKQQNMNLGALLNKSGQGAATTEHFIVRMRGDRKRTDTFKICHPSHPAGKPLRDNATR